MAKVLVVGGAGFLGSHAAKTFTRAGHEVVVFDNLSTGNRDAVRYGKLVEGDLLDRAALASLFSSFTPNAILHTAAKAGIAESVDHPAAYYEANVTGSLNLLEAARALPAWPAFIYASSCAVYSATEEPVSELAPIAPLNAFARSKRMVEEILADYGRAYGMPWVSLRCFNAAGADPEGELGERRDPPTHLIPRLLLNALDARAHPVQVFGGDYATPDGTCVRDYVHVADLAEGHLRAMEYLLRGGSSETFNLGTNQGSSVRDVIRTVERVTGKKLHVPETTARAGDPPRLVAGSKKARNILSFVPRHDLESVVRTAWNYVKDHR